MDNREFEHMLEQLLKQDFSAGTEAFRDDLLARCLAELAAAEHDDSSDDYARELSDSDLDMLAAAGNILSNPKDGLLY